MDKLGSESKPATRPLTARGNRPFRLGNAHADRLLSIVVAIAAEVTVLHDRLDTLERVASAKPRFSLEDLEHFDVTDEIEAERERWRRAFLRRMFRILMDEIGEQSVDERNRAYRELVTSLAR